jgi:spermidine synthase
VLAAVFVCAACGLVYELELVALASYLIGDSVTQASVVLSVMVFAMGCGSLLAKRLRARPAVAFAAVEAALALVGGLSVMALYACFAWCGHARVAVVGCAFAIGLLIGAEVPLLMTLVQRIRRQDAGGAVADLFAADYVGALVGGLAFPFLLLPHFGQLTGALATGMVNAAAGGAVVLWLFRRDLSTPAWVRLLLVNVLVLGVLGAAAGAAGPFERAAGRAMYGGPVRVDEHSAVQEIVLTGGGSPAQAGHLRLFLDGWLRACGEDTAAYQQALVDPAMLPGNGVRVLVLGGGDGLTAGRVLRYAGVRLVTVVDPDPALLRLARTDPVLSALGGHAFADRRVRAVAGDLFGWLRGRGAARSRYDLIIVDLPDPGASASAKLYAEEFYGLAARALAPGGRIALPAGRDPHTLWTLESTLSAAGLHSAAYAAGRPGCAVPSLPKSSAPWRFLVAVRRGASLPPVPAATPVPRPKHGLPPSTLLHPRL